MIRELRFGRFVAQPPVGPPVQTERLTQPSPYQGRIVAGLSEAELGQAMEVMDAYFGDWSMLFNEQKRRRQVIKQRRARLPL